MSNKKMEHRTYDISFSENSSEGLFLRGLVNQVGAWSQTLYDKNGNPFVERILPNVFAKALKRGNDIKLLLEHQKDKMFARTQDETLKLTESARGLEMEAELPNSEYSEHIHKLIERGTLRNMSFGMVVLDDKWTRENGVDQRSITDLALYEVSIVADPAYTQSVVEARSEDFANEIEIPQIKQGDVLQMDLKKMTEKEVREYQQSLLLKVDEMNSAVETENHSLSTDEEFIKRGIFAELDKIDEKLGQFSKNKYKGTEVREMQNHNSKDAEVRTVEQFIRKQDSEEVRTMTTATGVITVPTHLSNHIVKKVEEQAPLFSRTRNFTPVNGFLEVLRESSIGTGGFVGEMQDIKINDFNMNKIRLDQKRVGSAIELSQHLVNDSGIDVVNYSINILARRLAKTLDDSILIGDKATEFEGVMIDPGNSIEKIETEAANAISIDDCLRLLNAMHPELQKDAVFVVNRATFNKLSKLKDALGHYYLVRDVATTGVTYKLFGQPVLINDTMPKFEVGNKPVLFANFGEGYTTMTKKGLNLNQITDDTTQALRGSQLLMLDGYMDGKVLDPNAFKVLTVKGA